MTNELEKQFFDTFGIEPHYYCANEYIFEAMLIDECTDGNREKCKTCKKVGKSYPQITDRILLELLFILTTLMDTSVYEDAFVTVAKNIEELKKDIFQECMLYKQHIKHQVRTLFEEG